MLNEISHINDEEEARRLLMKLGNGLVQVEQYLKEWREAKKPAPVTKQKVVTNKVETVISPKVEKPTIVKK